MHFSLLVSLALFASTEAFVSQSKPSFASTSLFVRRGKGLSPKKEASSSSSDSAYNWIELPPQNQLPEEENVVKFIDTNLPAIKNGATNPTGAVACVKTSKGYYAFGCNCPACKVPMSKAKIADNILTCDFCKAAYDLKDGSKTETNQEVGFLGNVAKGFFSKQESGPLKLYKLGEKNGKLLISLD